LLITMTLGGLWHGANWTFVVWGIVHGLLLIGHRLFRDLAGARPRLDASLRSRSGTAFCVGLTFLTVCLTWVLFRAPSLAHAGWVFRGLFLPSEGSIPSPVQPAGLILTFLVTACCHALGSGKRWGRKVLWMPAPLAGAGYALVLTCVMVLAPASGKAFIYFQF
jgi:alginate O-acetyltransferase complex protein AlgI